MLGCRPTATHAFSICVQQTDGVTEEDRGPAPRAPEEAQPWAPLESAPVVPPSAAPQPWQTSPYGPYGAQPKAGDTRTGPLPLHPMTLSDILDGAFKLLKANWRTVLLITAVFVVPLHIISAFAQRNVYGGRSLFDAVNNPALQSTSGDNARFVVAGVVALVSLLVTPFVAGAISKVVAASYLGGEETVGSALRATGRRAWALLGAWILVHILEVIGGVL